MYQSKTATLFCTVTSRFTVMKINTYLCARVSELVGGWVDGLAQSHTDTKGELGEITWASA